MAPSRAAILALSLVVGVGCSSRSGGSVDGGADAGAIELDPALFDCRSIAGDPTARPARSSPVPAACALDPLCRTPMVCGHRSAGGALGRIAPENTLSAVRAAIALGIEFIETDPRPTADGVIVNVHDDDVDRTTTGTGQVDALTFAQLRALEIDAKGFSGDFSCDRIPTLREVLETARERVVVLVDANKTDRVDLLVQAIVEADAIDWAIFDTSSIAKIDQALAIEPRLHIQIRPGTLQEVSDQLDHFASQGRVPALVEIDADLRDTAPAVIHARGTRAFTDVFVEDARAGLAGDFSGYDLALDQGLDVLQTDRPELVAHRLWLRGARQRQVPPTAPD